MCRGATARELYRDQGLRFVVKDYDLVPRDGWKRKFSETDLLKNAKFGTRSTADSGGWAGSIRWMTPTPALASSDSWTTRYPSV